MNVSFWTSFYFIKLLDVGGIPVLEVDIFNFNLFIHNWRGFILRVLSLFLNIRNIFLPPLVSLIQIIRSKKATQIILLADAVVLIIWFPFPSIYVQLISLLLLILILLKLLPWIDWQRCSQRCSIWRSHFRLLRGI